jgi:hypothetical protein
VSNILLKVELDAVSRDFPTGGLIRGSVHLEAPAPVHARKLECRALWFTEGKGTEDVGGPTAVVLASDQVLDPGVRLIFELRLPLGPWSHGGRLVKIRWLVQLVLTPARGSAIDVEVPFRLVPHISPALAARAAGG